MQLTSQYSPAIDRLRGIAILMVVGYHFRPDLAPNGYLGVDLFFVISGYLITRQISQDLSTGEFSLKLFFARRIRRLLPATVVLLMGVTFAVVIWSPYAIRNYFLSVFATSLFSANFYFLLTTDYFSTDSATNPLLHMWSLGVEEQFYLVFPFILLVLRRTSARVRIQVFLALGAASLTLFVLFAPGSASFYLMPSRAWELLAGSLVFQIDSSSGLVTRLSVHPRIRAMTLWLLVGLFIPISLAHSDDVAPKMVIQILTVMVASVCVGFAGRPVSERRANFGDPLLLIGQMSFSLYLWHYPIVSIARLRNPLMPLTGQILLVTILMTLLSFFIIEKPFHQLSIVRPHKIVSIGIVASLLSATIGLAGYVWFRPGRYQFGQRDAIWYSLAKPEYPPHVRLDDAEGFVDTFDALLHGNGIFLVGDSFAGALSTSSEFRSSRAVYLSSGDCGLELLYMTDSENSCDGVVERLITAIERRRPSEIWLQFRWTFRKPYEDSLRRLLEDISSVSPSLRILVIGSTPIWSEPGGVPSPYLIHSNWDTIEWRTDTDRNLSLGFLKQEESLRERELEQDSLLDSLATRLNVSYIRPRESLCLGSSCLAVFLTPEGPKAATWDYGHLTSVAASYLWHEIVGSNS